MKWFLWWLKGVISVKKIIHYTKDRGMSVDRHMAAAWLYCFDVTLCMPRLCVALSMTNNAIQRPHYGMEIDQQQCSHSCQDDTSFSLRLSGCFCIACFSCPPQAPLFKSSLALPQPSVQITETWRPTAQENLHCTQQNA